MSRRVPARIAADSERLLDEVGPGPGRLLELGTAGIHAPVFALAGWEVVVAEDSPSALERARERAGHLADVVARDEVTGTFDVVLDHGQVVRP